MFLFLSFFLAFISILYEFNLAQIISLFYGNTFTIYAITIGLFTFSLGFGAIFFEKIKQHNSPKVLLLVELLLSLCALISPFLISVGNTLPLPGFFKYSIVFSPIVFCGFLSGIELPCLLDFNKNQKENILLWDYLGMFAGSLLFGLYLLEWLGPMKLTWVLSATNSLIAIYFYHSQYNTKKFPFVYTGTLCTLLFSIACISKEDQIYNWLGSFYGF